MPSKTSSFKDVNPLSEGRISLVKFSALKIRTSRCSNLDEIVSKTVWKTKVQICISAG